MKKFLFLLVSILTVNMASAQFKLIAEGPVFKEPEDGYAKILQLKNGNTIFIHLTEKDGIDTRIYNAQHQETAATHIEPAYGKLGHNGDVESLFEINGDVVLMASKFESRTPVLYRMIIDGKTGAVKEDKQIAQLEKLGLFVNYALLYGNVPIPNFFIRKDPASDNYALVLFNSFESERSKVIEIVSYGADNKETARAYYSSPNERYKYMRYVDMAVIGSNKVSVLAYAYNTAHSGGKESELIMANLDKGSTAVSLTELGFSKDLIVNYGICRYNPVTKNLVVVALAKEKQRDKGYVPIMALINPFDKKIIKIAIAVPSERINPFSNKEFTGLPQNLFIHSDGSFTIVSEEMTTVSYSNTYSKESGNTFLGNLAVVNYTSDGKLVTDYVVRKGQELSGSYLMPLYHSRREGSMQLLGKGNQFKSFAFISGNTNSYILFNDTERNNDKLETGKPVTVKGVSESDGFYYPVTGTQPTLKRAYLFGNPDAKHEHNLGVFTISDYNADKNIYTTLQLSNISGKKGVKVVWLQL